MKLKAIELEKAYNPKDFEDRIYSQWKEAGKFSPNMDKKDTFTIVMPPPNVTGILHMGHALNNGIQDVIIRYNRMIGKSTLWVPGSDHAGIATQNVVERILLKEGKTRQDLGREKFLEKTWEVKNQHHDIIAKQLEKIGCSCDWDRERFTMDEGLSKAVRESFVTLYERGMIYKGNYLVNYCPKCGTALADDEVEHSEVPGKLYDVKYPYADGSGSITIATTRPETMFGDVAVAVNPEDERYTSLVGKMISLPLTDREIPIIADSFVDIGFGTGMVKITPAHDPNDWNCGKRHNLEAINLLNPDGTLNENVPEKYRKMDVVKARKLVVEDLKEQGYLLGEKEHNHEVGHCYRCNTVVEPYLSEQWFVKMDTMAEKALKAWKQGEVNFYPKRWENTYVRWLEGIRDWCISRQLWWGHRIPVWYCNKCGQVMVKREDPDCCDKCGSKDIRQETDVLDTWFSSWLWPFSTLGWPDKTPDLEKFFPTQSLVTGYDIIFFWVSRMIMASLEFFGKVPFKDIYITGLVRDNQGRKMSKSLGNGIDPIKVTELYGADAMKFTLCYLSTQGQDILIDMDTFKLGSKFANKIWNATRFILMNLDGTQSLKIEDVKKNVIDKWIYHKFNEAVKKTRSSIESYKFNEASQAIYDFFWNDYCDWYVEICKSDLYSEDADKKNKAVTLLLDLLIKSLKLMHPFLSFITEEIYDKLPSTQGMIIDSSYPEYEQQFIAEKENAKMLSLQDIVKAIRNVRSELVISPEKRIKVILKPDEQNNETVDFLFENKTLISNFVKASSFEIDSKGTLSVEGALPVALSGYNLYVFVREALDVEQEIDKLKKDLLKIQKSLKESNAKLANEKFISFAKKEAIDKEKSKKAEFEEKMEKTETHIKVLKSF
ncbi:MAG: valine--tRNA ligase [Sphaerochaetaceae bacterium]